MSHRTTIQHQKQTSSTYSYRNLRLPIPSCCKSSVSDSSSIIQPIHDINRISLRPQIKPTDNQEEEVNQDGTSQIVESQSQTQNETVEPVVEVGENPNNPNDVGDLPTNVESLENISGEGEISEAVAYAKTLRLQGQTNASFSNSFATQNVNTTSGSSCSGCPPNRCVRATGDLQSTFNVTTTVTLPRVSQFPNLTPCQRERVQNAIDHVLAPHEQQHVDAFHIYDGTVSTPFDLTLCRANFNTRIQQMHNSLQSSRRAAAQSASDALDPFHFDVNLDCED